MLVRQGGAWRGAGARHDNRIPSIKGRSIAAFNGPLQRINWGSALAPLPTTLCILSTQRLLFVQARRGRCSAWHRRPPSGWRTSHSRGAAPSTAAAASGGPSATTSPSTSRDTSGPRKKSDVGVPLPAPKRRLGTPTTVAVAAARHAQRGVAWTKGSAQWFSAFGRYQRSLVLALPLADGRRFASVVAAVATSVSADRVHGACGIVPGTCSSSAPLTASSSPTSLCWTHP